MPCFFGLIQYFKHHTIQETEKQLNSAFIKHSVGTSKPQQNASLYIYKENKDIEDIDLESNFLQNPKEVKTPQIKTVKFKKRTSNERKKPTNAEKKARIYHFNQYKEPQDLKYHYPLTKEDASRLQSLSGRDFSLNAMNEILLDMSKRLDKRFCSKAQFMAYLAGRGNQKPIEAYTTQAAKVADSAAKNPTTAVSRADMSAKDWSK